MERKGFTGTRESRHDFASMAIATLFGRARRSPSHINTDSTSVTVYDRRLEID
jgi:hypothetical protein